MRGLAAILTNPLVRQIARPLISDIVDWVRGRKWKPSWLSAAEREIHDLRTPVAVADARARKARKSG